MRHPQPSWWARVDELSPPLVRCFLYSPHPSRHKGPPQVYYPSQILSVKNHKRGGCCSDVGKRLIQFVWFFLVSKNVSRGTPFRHHADPQTSAADGKDTQKTLAEYEARSCML